MRCANPPSRHCLRDPIAAQGSSVPPRTLQLTASSQKPPSHRLLRRPCVARPRMEFELLSSDCAKLPTHCWGTVALRSACTLLWLSGSLLKILFSGHPFTHNRSRTLRFCGGTLSFGEIGSCEFLVDDFLGLVFSQRYGHGYAPFLCASRSSSSS